MKKLYLFLIIFGALPCFAQTPCGLANNTTRMVAPNYARATDPNYSGTQFLPPNVPGATFTDSLSGCVITQLTYGGGGAGCTTGTTAMRHEYSNMSPINSDNTLIELLDTSGQWIVCDLLGNIVVPVANVPWSGGLGARWDATDPYTIYYTGAAKFWKVVIPTNYNACRPSCNVTTTMLHDFSALYISGAAYFQFAGGEGDIQLNANGLTVLCGIHLGATAVGSCEASAGSVDIFEYNYLTDTVGTKLVLSGTPALEFDSAQLTADGRVMIDWDHTSAVPCTSGPCHYGIELYDANMNWVSTPWFHGSSHTKETYYNGNYYLVLVDSGPYVCADQGIVSVNINTLVQTCILNKLPWIASPHIGATEDGTGWVVMDHNDFEAVGAASYPLAANWNLDVTNGAPTTAGYWGLYTQEVMLIRVDGSSNYRMTWNRSRPNAASYWKASRCSISRNGKYVVCDSDYGQGVNTPTSDYTDVFMIDTGLVITAATPMGISGGIKASGGIVIR